MLNLSSLNPQQRQAVEALRGPVLILAGAGTGKTRVITYRIAHMVQSGIAPGQILGVTFTNKAAREMRERVKKLLPRNRPASSELSSAHTDHEPRTPDSPTICTFHSLCVRILRQHIERLGYKRNFVIYDESEQLGAIRKILSHISAKGEKADPAAILALLSRFKNGGERAAVFGEPNVRALAEHVRSRYESALRACNAVDFDDLILLTLRLFDEHPDALAACCAKYQFVMVDEYQDTNAAQFRLVHALTREHQNLCVVGDDDQSIYGWRGAEIANLLEMEKHYPEVKLIKLEQNYRSTNTILKAANAVIKHNVRRRGKQLWSQKGDGPRLSLHTFENDEEEARTIVELIEYARLTRRAAWSEQAILFRTNLQSRPLETALRQGGVRYHLIGGQSFFDRREVRDFLAYLKVLFNPDDDISLLRIANVPARGLSDVTMERLLQASHERQCSVFQVMKNPAVTATFQSAARGAIAAFVELIENTRGRLTGAHGQIPLTPALSQRERENQNFGETGGAPITPDVASGSPSPWGEGRGEGEREVRLRSPTGFLYNWADRFLDHIGYFNELRRAEKSAEASEARIRNLKELMSTMDRGAVAGAPYDRLQSFLEEISLDTEREEEDEGPDNAVTLITMHSCKGLEFPHVYIVGLEEGLLPHSRSKEEGTLDEERRLFYVALTRAMQTLTLSHCHSRKKFGQAVPGHPSRFLSDLPPDLVEHADEKGKQPVAPESGKKLFDFVREAVG